MSRLIAILCISFLLLNIALAKTPTTTVPVLATDVERVLSSQFGVRSLSARVTTNDGVTSNVPAPYIQGGQLLSLRSRSKPIPLDIVKSVEVIDRKPAKLRRISGAAIGFMAGAVAGGLVGTRLADGHSVTLGACILASFLIAGAWAGQKLVHREQESTLFVVIR